MEGFQNTNLSIGVRIFYRIPVYLNSSVAQLVRASVSETEGWWIVLTHCYKHLYNLMVKQYFPKNERNELAITIKKLHETGMKQIDIAKLFNISKRKVNYWIHNPIILKRKRRTILIQKEKN